MKKFKLMADFQCYPLWIISDVEAGDINPDILPISASLKEDLHKWAQKYNATFNAEYPPDSGFPSAEAEILFKKEGQSLRDRLQRELGDNYEIIYNLS